MIFFFIILTLTIIIGKYINELYQFNHSAELIQIQNPNHLEIKESIRTRSPLLIHNLIGKYDLSELSLDSWVDWCVGYLNTNLAAAIFRAKSRTFKQIWRFVDFADFCFVWVVI